MTDLPHATVTVIPELDVTRARTSLLEDEPVIDDSKSTSRPWSRSRRRSGAPRRACGAGVFARRLPGGSFASGVADSRKDAVDKVAAAIEAHEVELRVPWKRVAS